MKRIIWWLSQRECESIGDELPEPVADYIRAEYISRLGRPGGGRLWVNDAYVCLAPDEVISVDPWPGTALGEYLQRDFGGIVLWDRDAEALRQYPGIFTDLQLRRVY